MTGKTKHRATIKARMWNHHDPKKPKAVAATGLAWWIPGAQPDGRDVFMELAKQRHAKANWKPVAMHPTNPNNGYR